MLDRKSIHRAISLIGMPGSGKSTVGVLIAKRLGLDFIDTDLLIQSRENATLPEIIARTDHQYLRDLEERVLLEMPIHAASVISTGGSVVYSPLVMERLAAQTTVVYLQAQFDTVEYRISLAPDRGIASPGNHTLADVYAERVPLYEQYADITIDVDEDAPESIAGHIIAKLDAISV